MLYRLEPGTLAEVVTDDLVLRSAPRVSPDSEILPETLNAPTRVYIRGGPVEADGYAWFLVDVVDDGGQHTWAVYDVGAWQVSGWVASGGKDGEQWLAPLGRSAGEWAVTSAQHLGYPATRHATPGPDGRVYIFGGQLDDAGSEAASSSAYDANAGSWEPIAPMPTARDYPLVAVADDRIYVIGGVADSALSVVEIYDPSANRWESGPPFPEPVAAGSAATTGADGSIYVFGHDGVWSYAPADAAWRSVTDTPIAADDAVTMPDGTIHVLDVYGAIRSFDPESAILGPLNLARMTRSDGTMVATPDSRLLVVGGYWAGGGCIVPGSPYDPGIEDYPGTIQPPLSEAFDPQTRSWHTFAPLPPAFRASSAVVLDDRILIIGSRSTASPGGFLQTDETVVAEFLAPGELAAEGMAGLPTDDLTARGCGDYL